MKQRIFRAGSIVAVLVLFAAFTLLFCILYPYFTDLREEELRLETELAAAGVEACGQDFLLRLSPREKSRFTWIDPEGTVLYDSAADPARMENHADREEFREALEKGFGESSRYSVTLAEKTLYRARRLGDGSVIRLSVTRDSALIPLLGLLLPFLLILGGGILLSALLAARNARRIVEPLNALDLEDPLSNDLAYEELAPLLRRIDLQHRQIHLQLSALQRKQEEFDAITKSMQEGLILLNADGEILSINKSALKLYNSDESCIGRDFLLLDRSLPMQTLLEKAKNGERGEVRKDFSGREYQLDLSPIFKDGEAQGAVLLLFDVTEKALSEQLRREFTANVSHELKTPLQTIAGSAELLVNGLVKAEDEGRFLEQIFREARRMIALIDDIIRLSRLDEGEISPQALPKEQVDLRVLGEDVLEQLAGAAEAQGIRLSVKGEAPMLQTNAALLREILYNLVDNAIKYNRPGGEVSLLLKPRAFSVRDTGIGIPLSEQERIFERFYRVDKSHSRRIGGTGLGLSIVKHAALQLGLRMEVESREGEGSCFRLLFPEE